MTAEGIRLGRKPTDQEFDAWIAAVYEYPWRRVAATRLATAQAIVDWARLMGADFLRAGQRKLALLAGLPQTTVAHSIKSLVNAGFLHIDAPGDRANLRAATYSLVFHTFPTDPPPARNTDGWLGTPGLWSGNCYGRQAYRIAVEVSSAGAEGTTAASIAARLNLHRATVRKYLRLFHDDGFVYAPKGKHQIHLLALDGEELDRRIELTLERRRVAAKGQLQAARYKAEQEKQKSIFRERRRSNSK